MANGGTNQTDPEIPPVHTTIEVTDQMPPDYKGDEKLRTEGQKEAGWFERLWATKYSAIAEIPLFVLDIAAKLIKPIMVKFVPVLSAATEATADEQAEMTSVIIKDVLAANLDTGTIRQLFTSGKEAEAFEQIGGVVYASIFDRIMTEDTLSPEQGLASAKKFLGYVTNFRIKEGIQKFVLDVIGWEWLDKYDGIADELFSGLSLERHSRAALRPAIETTIATPLDWYFNKLYRPTLLSESIAVREFLRENVAAADFYEEMARKGYSRARTDAVINSARLHLGDSDLDKLVRHGRMDANDALKRVRDRGYNLDDAVALLHANDLGPADARVREFVNVLERLTLDRVIDLATFNSQLDDLPLSPEERKWEKVIVEIQLALPRRRLSLAQMREAFLHATVDLTEWREFLRQEGYSDRDAQVLTIELLLDLADETKKAEGKRLQEERLAALAAERAAAGENTETT